VSDLPAVADDVKVAGTHEFVNREDALLGLQKALGVTFPNTTAMDPGVIYTAVDEGLADVGSGFGTDGRIAAFELEVVEDDIQFFPTGVIAPIVRGEVAQACPGVVEALSKLGGQIDTKTAQQLNKRFDIDGEDANSIAESFLTEKGLLN